MKQLWLLQVIVTGSMIFCAFSLTGAPAPAGGPPGISGSPSGKQWVYVGTYTGAKSKGIYLSQLDAKTGKLTPLELAAETPNPTFLAIHPNQRLLYAANEVNTFAGKRSGAVTAYALDPRTGKLTRLNQQSSGGPGPCHLVVDRSGRAVLVANYSGGSVAVLPVKGDGELGEASTFIQHQGSSVDRARQEGPHAHGIALDARNRFALVADLGLDKVLVYRLNAAKGTLTANAEPWAAIKPGSGPRHIAFDPQGRFVYVINEMGSTITVLAWDGGAGVLSELQTVSTLPSNFKGNNTTAEIQVHPSGKFLYGSNRGQESIAVFAIDQQTGKLSLVEHQSTRGKMPRNFGIDLTGRWLVAANQSTDNLVAFRIDEPTGRLQTTGQELEVGAPVCVQFVPSR